MNRPAFIFFLFVGVSKFAFVLTIFEQNEVIIFNVVLYTLSEVIEQIKLYLTRHTVVLIYLD